MTEQDYDELRRLGQKLHIPTPEQFWSFSVQDKQGNVVHEHEERGHSWVRNAYNLLTSQMCTINGSDLTFAPGKINLKTTSGSISAPGNDLVSFANVENTAGNYGCIGAANSNNNGIVVGTGNMAWTFEDYKLAAIIASGTSSGQLSYALGSPPVKSYAADTRQYSANYTRVFNNNSGGSIVVAEVGLYRHFNGPDAMITRDILASPVTVAVGAQLTVSYTVTVTFPA